MKINIILLFFSFLLLSNISKGQNILKNSNNQIIVSTLSSSSQPPQIKDIKPNEGDNRKIRVSAVSGKSEIIITRKVSIKQEERKNSLTLSISRIQQKGNSFEGAFDIDTDSPFPNNQTEKMTIDHYNQFIKKPFIMDWDKTSHISDLGNYNNNLWNMDFPKLHVIEVLSGILFSISEKKTWTDSLYDEKGTYINNYQILEETNKTYKISLKGHYIGKDIRDIEVENQKKELPKSGETIQAKTTVNSMEYTGEIFVNKKTEIIENLSMQLIKNATVSVLGKTVAKDNQIYFLIENKFK